MQGQCAKRSAVAAMLSWRALHRAGDKEEDGEQKETVATIF
jgi:hypothetical protein